MSHDPNVNCANHEMSHDPNVNCANHEMSHYPNVNCANHESYMVIMLTLHMFLMFTVQIMKCIMVLIKCKS